MNHPFTIEHINAFTLGAALDQQLHTGNGGSTGSHTNNFGVFDVLALNFQRVEHTGRCYNGGTVLIVMEYRNLAAFDQFLLDFETFRRFDIFKINTAERISDIGNRVDEFFSSPVFNFNIDGIQSGKTLKQ